MFFPNCATNPQSFPHLETQAPLQSVLASLATANAYLGAAPLVDALNAGANILITGRVADPSLSVAPCISHFGWNLNNYDRIAGGDSRRPSY